MVPWRSARSFAELIPVPESWRRYVPGLELPILDISRMDDASMTGHPILQVALMLLKYGRQPDLETSLRPLFQMLSQTITLPQAKNLLDTIRIYVMSVNPIVGEEKMDEIVTEFWPVQPEPGSIADQLLKKGQARGEEIGRARGEEIGRAHGEEIGRMRGEKAGQDRGEKSGELREKVNTIRMLQSILGVAQSSSDELLSKDVIELQSMISALQNQVSSRLSK